MSEIWEESIVQGGVRGAHQLHPLTSVPALSQGGGLQRQRWWNQDSTESGNGAAILFHSLPH